jgi:hypothetical protein
VDTGFTTPIKKEQRGAGTIVKRKLNTCLSLLIRKGEHWAVFLAGRSVQPRARNAVLIHDHQGSRHDKLQISGRRRGPQNVRSLKTGSKKATRDREDNVS